jgi:putative nucleotidyltransferase with HDIG domain
MSDKVALTIEFIRKKLLEEYNKEYLSMVTANPDAAMQYRFNHSLRVAAIGAKIAQNEGMDVEAMTVACLLHDVGYSVISKEEDYSQHGWLSEEVARPFVQTLGFDHNTTQNILCGISSHVDGKCNFEWEQNTFTQTVSDSDNIDRFDAYRLYETLKFDNFDEKSLDDQKLIVSKRLPRLKELYNMHLATPTAVKMWQDVVAFQISYYERLKKQLELTIE